VTAPLLQVDQYDCEPETAVECDGQCGEHYPASDTLEIDGKRYCRLDALSALCDLAEPLLAHSHSATEEQARRYDQAAVTFRALLREVEAQAERVLAREAKVTAMRSRGGGRCACGGQMIGPGQHAVKVNDRWHVLSGECGAEPKF
jgi:predicted SprT family Zn-dependent metalloprotease